mmetsp:Transcript_43638/g.113735  ORF Transcript_43638/g.113735 Transcript_43638/m.113735 type:complete len:218 (+) Transcript_43638:1287-1940(+)
MIVSCLTFSAAAFARSASSRCLLTSSRRVAWSRSSSFRSLSIASPYLSSAMPSTLILDSCTTCELFDRNSELYEWFTPPLPPRGGEAFIPRNLASSCISNSLILIFCSSFLLRWSSSCSPNAALHLSFSICLASPPPPIWASAPPWSHPEGIFLPPPCGSHSFAFTSPPAFRTGAPAPGLPKGSYTAASWALAMSCARCASFSRCCAANFSATCACS